MSDPVPAIAEAAATGEIAAIFADIRAVYRVGVVNLVWRHLATIEGALPWVWATVRPLYADGRVARAAAALRAEMALPALPPLPACATEAAGLDAPARAATGAVMAGYDRTNAMALVALGAVIARLDGVHGAPPPALPPPPENPAVDLPPLPALESLAPPVAALILALNRLGADRDDPLLASMYRHLAYWPPCLALAWAQLAPLHADGRLPRAIAATRARAAVHAAGLAATLPPAPLPAPALAAAIRAGIARFTDDPIARMLVNCALLRASWPAAEGTTS